MRVSKRPRSEAADPDQVPVGTKVVVTKAGRHFHHQTAVVKGYEDTHYVLELLDGEGTATTLKRSDFVTIVPDAQGGTVINGFTLEDRRTFYTYVMSFGISDASWSKANTALPHKQYRDVCSYAMLFLKHLGNPPGEGPLYADAGMDNGVPQKVEEIHSVLERVSILHLLHRKALQFEPGNDLSHTQKDWFSAIKVNCSKKYQMKSHGLIKMPMGWPPELDRRLIQAVVACGYGNWRNFVSCVDTNVLEMLCPEATSWNQLNSEEKHLVACIVEGRTADIAMSVSKEYRTRHNAGENLSAFNLEPKHMRQQRVVEVKEQERESAQEVRRQMVDEWSYHEPMVGTKYQAEIPNLLKRCRENRYSLQRQAILQENYTEAQEGRLVWDCHRLDPDVIEQYLTLVKDWGEQNPPTDDLSSVPYKLGEESLLDFLHANGGSFEQAIESLKLGYRALCRAQAIWDSSEMNAFVAAYEHYGKDFKAIADALPRKSWKQVADFYFKHRSDEHNVFNLPTPCSTPRNADEGSRHGPASPGPELTAEEHTISKTAQIAPAKLMTLKQKLVEFSAHEGKISRSRAYELVNHQDSIWAVKLTDESVVDSLFDLLASRQLIRPEQ
eukprot:TRINITY_DN4545_c0_g1_i1.p1 TRINITY_DN4545_c0_g1~~TRINITY_DN4545_c0_g1_i1.p1  ORF type:complete len:612 (-),score=121.24 TRINITY_DN4545_c0_g1_i1:55-1890(-)